MGYGRRRDGGCEAVRRQRSTHVARTTASNPCPIQASMPSTQSLRTVPGWCSVSTRISAEARAGREQRGPKQYKHVDERRDRCQRASSRGRGWGRPRATRLQRVTSARATSAIEPWLLPERRARRVYSPAAGFTHRSYLLIASSTCRTSLQMLPTPSPPRNPSRQPPRGRKGPRPCLRRPRDPR
ncbi:hypothetical protein K466DRAFT_336997 [Polyporus arcularius HHB13444]|uniref:Uncharacterized protein n=1 Tax=Polyporus arcularius HHB13444 TaxID=1314778 RepID=A0A5C3NY59_9APHY|nr:hypothetical protein K466DRAFT_336997 [Polyporus arcularius HHB13444]